MSYIKKYGVKNIMKYFHNIMNYCVNYNINNKIIIFLIKVRFFLAFENVEILVS